MKIEIKTLTPQEAAHLLTFNESNRPLNEKVVERYSKEMAMGNWELNGESIKFDKKGNLIDGQHRLAAAIRQTNPVDFMLVSDLEPSAKFTVDQGKKRTSSDVLAIAGLSNSLRLGTFTKRVMLYNRNPKSFESFKRSGTIGHITNKDLIEFVLQNQTYMERIVDTSVSLQNTFKGLNSGQYAATIHAYTQAGHNIETITEILSQLARNQEMEKGNPLMALRSKLQNWYTSFNFVTGDTYRNNIFSAINSYVTGENITNLRITGYTTVSPIPAE